jgi:hypothetical protein
LQQHLKHKCFIREKSLGTTNNSHNILTLNTDFKANIILILTTTPTTTATTTEMCYQQQQTVPYLSRQSKVSSHEKQQLNKIGVTNLLTSSFCKYMLI